MPQMLFFPKILRSPIVPVAVGLGSLAVPLMRPRILNEPLLPTRPTAAESLATYGEPVRGKGITHFNGAIDYHQMTFGSFTGMLAGYFFGRISKILVGVIVSSLMATDYLSRSGYVDLRPFQKTVYQFCLKHWKQEVMVQDPSFKYSFGLAFLIAAYNA